MCILSKSKGMFILEHGECLHVAMVTVVTLCCQRCHTDVGWAPRDTFRVGILSHSITTEKYIKSLKVCLCYSHNSDEFKLKWSFNFIHSYSVCIEAVVCAVFNTGLPTPDIQAWWGNPGMIMFLGATSGGRTRILGVMRLTRLLISMHSK